MLSLSKKQRKKATKIITEPAKQEPGFRSEQIRTQNRFDKLVGKRESTKTENL